MNNFKVTTYTAKALQGRIKNDPKLKKTIGAEVLDLAYEILWNCLGLSKNTRSKKYHTTMSAVFYLASKYNVDTMIDYDQKHRKASKVKQSENELRFVLNKFDQKFGFRDGRVRLFHADVILKAVAIVNDEYFTNFVKYPFMKRLSFYPKPSLTPVRSNFERKYSNQQSSTPISSKRSSVFDDSGYNSPLSMGRSGTPTCSSEIETPSLTPITANDCTYYYNESLEASYLPTEWSYSIEHDIPEVSGLSQLTSDYKTFPLPDF